LLERSLHEIVVMFVASPEDAPQGPLHDTDQPVVEPFAGLAVAALERVDELGVGRLVLAGLCSPV
jgi:hypothetical protein